MISSNFVGKKILVLLITKFRNIILFRHTAIFTNMSNEFYTVVEPLSCSRC